MKKLLFPLLLIFTGCMISKEPYKRTPVFIVKKVVTLKDGWKLIYFSDSATRESYSSICQCDSIIKGMKIKGFLFSRNRSSFEAK